MVECNSMTREQILGWLDSSKTADEYMESVKPKSDNYKCPKSDKCIMDCYHKKPHAYDERFCNDTEQSGNVGVGNCNVICVHELISDVTFFKEDFEV